MGEFTHIHTHSKYSLNDGMIKPKELAKKLKELGMKKIAITEHGEMFNMPENYLALKDEGIELIIGCEVYVAPRSRLQKESRELDMANYHLVLLCENQTGYDNLKIIVSDARTNGFYNKPRTDKEFLREHHEGLIASSACLAGSVNRLLLNDRYEDAKKEALEYQDIFGKGNFFLEIQRHGLEDQIKIDHLIIQLSRDTGIPLIATNDSHYLNKDDWEAHDVLMAIQAKTTIYDKKRKVYGSHEFYIKSQEEMIELFRDIPEAIENTGKIADRCHVELEFGVNKIPPFDPPPSFKGTNEEYLRMLVYTKCEELFGRPLSQERVDRIEYEIGVIRDMGYINYFLIVWDFFRFCDTGAYEIDDQSPDGWEPIIVGPGRGCFLPDQKVYMKDGCFKNIENIQDGDYVIGQEGINKVYSTFKYDIDEDIIKINIGGSKIRCTNDHKILVIKSKPCNNPSYKNVYCSRSCRISNRCNYNTWTDEEQWVSAKDIKRGDYMIFPIQNDIDNIKNIIDICNYVHVDENLKHDYSIDVINKLTSSVLYSVPRFINIDNNFARLSGLFLGNGWSRIRNNAKNKRTGYEIGFSLNTTQYKKYKNVIINTMKHICGNNNLNVIESWNKRKTCCQIIFSNKIMAKLFNCIFGESASNKEIPNFIMRNKDIRQELLIGLFDTDGCVDHDSKITYSTTSEKMAYQIRILLNRYGIYSSIIRRKRKDEYKHWKIEFKVSISSIDAKKLHDIIRPETDFNCSSKSETTFTNNNKIFKRVYSVETEHYIGPVYDLGVENNPSYNIDGYIVHNSGAGSIVARALDITKIDPLEYDLLFERFLDPSRISMPDIDSDFESERRQEVIDYVVYKYGRDSIAQIITFGTLAARAVIRAVGRALDYKYNVYDEIAKMIPKEVGITIPKALKMNPELEEAYNKKEDIRKLLDTAMKLEGLPTNTSTHAAGVLITDKKGVLAHVPVWVNDSAIVAQYDKDILESLGLLKMDFLGLKTLGVLGQTKKFVKQNYGEDIDFNNLYTIPTLEPLKLIREGKTAGIFQLEGAGMTSFMKDLQPNCIEDIIAGISLYRPGPMNEIPRFLACKRNPDKVIYPFNGDSKEILSPTYGVLTYQEQCMQIVVKIAGYDRSDSDGFRKVISKKKLKEMPLHHKWFIEGRKERDFDQDKKERTYKPIPGGLAMGYKKDELEAFWGEMIDFAKYAFNKSHAAAYAFVAYVTAWAMYYYPTEFVAGLLNFCIGVKSKTSFYLNYCKNVLDIEILEPDINESDVIYIPTKDRKILYPLSVKGTKSAALTDIINERKKNGPFKNMMDFLIRTRDTLDKSTYESLIGCGAFKSFNITKSQLLAAIDDFWDGALKKTKTADKNARQKGKPFDFEKTLREKMKGIFPDISEFPRDIELRLERELTGFYLSDNPLYKYSFSIKNMTNFSSLDVQYEIDEDTGDILLSSDSIKNNQRVKFVAMINSIDEINTKDKRLMGKFELEDLDGIVTALMWSDTYSQYKKILKENYAYWCEGYIMMRKDDPPTLVIDEMSLMEDVVTERAVLFIEDKHEAVEIINHIKSDKMSQGMTPFYLIYNNQKVLLSKEFWINVPVMSKSYPKLMIQTY